MDMVSLEAEKMITIHTSAGSQYFKKARNFGTTHGTLELAASRVIVANRGGERPTPDRAMRLRSAPAARSGVVRSDRFGLAPDLKLDTPWA